MCIRDSDCTKSYALEDIEKLTKELGGLDLFIISAGRGTLNLKLDFDLEDKINKLNVIAFTNLVNWGMLFFEKQGFGHLANISSVASQRGGGLAPAYHASKAYQASYFEGMAQRAAHSKSNIYITDIRPGFVRTPMLQGKEMFWTSTKEKAAVQIVNAIKRKKRIVYITKRWRFAAWVFRRIPWFIFKKNKLNNSISIPNTSALLSQSSILPKLKPFLNILRIFSLIFIIIALARPQIIDVSTKVKNNQGIDIVMAIDVSASMLAKDLKPNRLEALKNVASNFILDRTNDRIGLVEYAGESYTKTPITSDKNIIIKSLNEINYNTIIEGGTAIGMGLATSVNRIKDSKAKSKVIILLTDGVNNSGFIDPNTAAELAIEYGIKIYTIGIGTCLLYTSPSPRDATLSRMPSSA